MPDFTPGENFYDPVDEASYRRRWREEIEEGGGFERLDTERELMIRYKLKHELCIYGLQAPEPGGEEWLQMGLRWPVE